MRKEIFVLCLLVIFLPALTSAATINAASCSYDDVSAAINAAQYTDTVQVPAGTCTWNTELVINKGIYLIGAGSGNTIITSNYNNSDGHLIVYTPSDFSTNNPFRISGFTFDLNDKCSAILLNGRPSLVIQTKIRIDHNTFTGVTSSYAYQGITNWGMRGVVDNNLWDNIPYPIRNDLGYRSGQEWWDNWEAVVFGKTDNNIYFEDNTFTGLTIVADCAYANRYIFRYNTITANAGAWPLFDMHGNQLGGSMWGCFGGELYGNQINSNYDVDLEDHRGGKMLIFMNNKNTTVTNDAWYIQVRDTDPDSDNPTTNPSPQYPSDSYYWLNRRNLNGAFTSIQEGAHSDNPPLLDCPMENRDFFVGTDSFNGTMGMGYGPLAARPATCTVGVGYWATDQSVSSLSGMVGKNPATPISGTLYKCTAPNTWTAYYTPYTYPHPLRTDCVNYPGLCDSGAKTINAVSCSYADVSAAINSSQNGDTVLVPAGSCTWSNQLVITKGIQLIGAGIDKTVITSNYAYDTDSLIFINPSDYDANNPFRLSGFTFDFANKCSGITLGQARPAPFTIQTKVRIDHNRFLNPAHQVIWNNCVMYGVVDNNIFEAIPIPHYPIRTDPNTNGITWWENFTISFGAANDNIYFEDNTFNNLSNDISDCAYAGRYAFRYNTIISAGTQGFYALLDMHGNQGGGSTGMYACFGAEIYGNNIDATSFGTSNGVELFDHRGGKALVFYNNDKTSYPSGYYIQVRDEFDDSLNPPATGPTGQPQHVSDSYYWSNVAKTKPIEVYVQKTLYYSDLGREVPLANYDFWNYNASFNGSAGMGCGPLANRPASCTPGVGYWATNQSCTDLTGMVGAHPATPISGTLYKCSATNTWTPYYKPYIYPHPLTVAPFGTTICDEGQISSECWCEGMKSNGYCCHGYYQQDECDTTGESSCDLPGDLNCDGVVDVADLIIVASDFGKTSGYNFRADTDTNGIIDIFDIVFVASRFT